MINPLWLSVSTFNFTMASSVYSLMSNGFSFNGLMSWGYSKPLIVFGLIPLVMSFISIIACFCACCVCCCNSYVKYHKVNLQLQQEASQILKSSGIECIGMMPDEKVITDDKVSQEDKDKIQNLQNQIAPKYNLMMKKGKKAKWCWLIWFPVTFLYFLCMIYILIGAQGLVQMPTNIMKVVNKEVTTTNSLLTAVATGMDTLMTNVLEDNVTIVQDFLNATDFNTSADAFGTVLNEVKPVHALIDTVKLFVDGMTDFIGSILFMPTPPAGQTQLDYATATEASAQSIQDGFTGIKNDIQSVTDSLNTLNSLTLPTVVSIPAISFDPATMLSSMQQYIDLITQSHTQAEFMNNLNNVFSLPYFNLLVQIDSSGTKQSVDLLQTFGINLDSYISMITDMVPGLVSNLKDWKNFNYTDYLQSLQTITFNDFLSQLQDQTCKEMWCGLLPEESIAGISTKLQGFAPGPLKSFVTFTTPDQFTSKVGYLVYGLALIIPIIVLWLSCYCMLLKKPFCSCYSICYCPICQIFSAIFGIIMLMISFFSSALMVPMTNALEGDMTAMQDEILGFMSSNSIVSSETIDLPATSYVTFDSSNVSIALNSTSDLYSSLLVNGTINNLSTIVSGEIPDLSSYDTQFATFLPILGVNSLSDIITAAINNIDGKIPKNVTINLEGTDFGHIFDVSQTLGILNMIKNNNASITDYLVHNLNAILSAALDDQFSAFYGALNFTTLYANIANFDVNSIFSLLGIDLNSVIATAAQAVSTAMQTAYCAMNSLPSQTTQASDLLTFTWDFTNNFLGTSSSMPSAPSISHATIGVLESLYVNLWLEYEYSQGILPSSITTPTSSTQVKGYITNNLIISTLNTKADVGQFVLDKAQDGAGMDSMFSDINGVNQTQIDGFNNNLPTPAISKLVDIPSWFAKSLHTRTNSGSATVPTKPTTTSDSTYSAYVTMDAKYVAYVAAMKGIYSAVNGIDTHGFAARIQDVLNLQQVFDIVSSLQTLIQNMNDNLLGYYAINTSCPVSGNPSSTLASSFLVSFPTLVEDIVLGVIKNVVFLLGPSQIGSQTNWNNKFQQAFINSKLFSSLTGNITAMIGNVTDFIVGDNSPISSQLFGMIPDTMGGMVAAIFLFADGLSFAIFLSSMFLFFGPCVMCCSYTYVKMQREDKKWVKKYKTKPLDVFLFGKPETKSTLVTASPMMFANAVPPPVNVNEIQPAVAPMFIGPGVVPVQQTQMIFPMKQAPDQV